MNKKLIVLSIVGLVLIGIIAGKTFSYFSTANNEGVENVVESGTMALLFTDGPQIIADKLAPGEYIEKTFKVKNTGNVDTRYDVYFSEVINTFVDQSDLVYTLASNDGGYNTTSEVVVPNEASKIVNQYLIRPNEEHTYTLRITFKLKETIQNVNMGRTFTAKININEFNLNSGEHFLKLIDANGEEVDKQILATNQENYTLALNNADLTNSTNIYCNNGGIPTISGNTLNVSGITNDTICTISNDIDDTINNKLTTSKTGIVMTNDQSDVAKMIIPSTKEVVLDLNGKEIRSVGVNDTSTTYNSNYEVISLNGKMTINDDDNNGGMFTGYNGDTIRVNAGANIVINGGAYKGRISLLSGGDNAYTEINNGSFEGLYYETISLTNNCKNCRMIVNDGNFLNNDNYRLVYLKSSDTGAIVINGGSFNVKNDGEIYHLNSPELLYAHTDNKGLLTINSGMFVGLGKIVYNQSSGTININGGVFISSGDSAIYNQSSGIININQSSESIYIGSMMLNTGWFPAVYNITSNNGVININASKANRCTADYNNTSSGLCVFSKSAAVVNNGGITKINGGSYVGIGIDSEDYPRWPAVEAYINTMYIKNAYIESENVGVGTSANGGILNICSSNIYCPSYDMRTLGSESSINYSSSVIFTDGTNNPHLNPSSGWNNGVLTQTEDACTWPGN